MVILSNASRGTNRAKETTVNSENLKKQLLSTIAEIIEEGFEECVSEMLECPLSCVAETLKSAKLSALMRVVYRFC